MGDYDPKDFTGLNYHALQIASLIRMTWADVQRYDQNGEREMTLHKFARNYLDSIRYVGQELDQAETALFWKACGLP